MDFARSLLRETLVIGVIRESSHLSVFLTRRTGSNDACIQKANRINRILVLFRSDYHFIVSL
jgi:hypothetical protein